MFGGQNQNADGGHAWPCITAVAGFGNDANSVEFGPIPQGGVTISQLQAVTNGSATGQTVRVLDNITATALTCTNTAGSSCSGTTHSVTIPAGDFIQVQVTGGTAAAWKVTFLVG
jgi:hypothetical protein